MGKDNGNGKEKEDKGDDNGEKKNDKKKILNFIPTILSICC